MQMECELHTGFRKITHDIQFNPQGDVKGQALGEAHRVRNIIEYAKNGLSYLLKAEVIRQTSVTSTPYKCSLQINAARHVTSSSCNCVANKSQKCKHIAAFIFAVNNHDSLTKTDVEQQWGKPTTKQYVQEKYSKGKFFYEMFPPTENKKEIKPFNFDFSMLKKPSPLKMIVAEQAKDQCEHAIQRLLSDILGEVELIQTKEECSAAVATCLHFVEDFDIYSKATQLPQHLLNFYENKIVKSKEDLVQLSCDTLGQSKQALWLVERRLRISGSKNAHDIKIRKTKSVDSLVNDMLRANNKSLGHVSAVKYGITQENNARLQYEKMFNCKVVQVGLMLSFKQPWACMSLDDVVVENECVTRIVEIKCPETCKDKSIVDFRAKKCNVRYLQFVDDEVTINESYVYFTQCQYQMYISGMSECDLFLYSPVSNGSFNLRILRDENFLKNVILHCEKFYFENYLPALYKIFNNESNTDKSIIGAKRKFTGVNVSNSIAY